MNNSKILVCKIIRQFLIIIFYFVSLFGHANARSISVKCKKWEEISFISNEGLSGVCEFLRFEKRDLFFLVPIYKCSFDKKCVEWEAIAKDEDNELYKDMIKSIDNNSTDFRDRIIKMLDTVTLQKLYDPNLVTVNP